MRHNFLYFFSFCFPLFFVGQQSDTTKTVIFPKLVGEIINLKPDYDNDEKVTIANLNEVNINEAPGSIYVVTSSEIEKNGYLDLLDVLLDVPGFNIASDVQNGVAPTLRGMWAAEAKLLFMIDGLVMNDMAYGSFIVGGRLSLVNIDRIEIIKGAGSSIYGGLAALGVVNIITKSGKKSSGSSFLVNTGISNNNVSRLGLGFNYGTSLVNGMDLTASGGIFEGNRSNKTITLPDSSEVNLRDSSSVNDAFVNFRVKFKGFEYGVNYNDYNFQATYEPTSSLVRTYNNALKYTFNKAKFTLIPYAGFKKQVPWNTQYGDPKIYDVQNIVTRRIIVGSNLNFQLNSFMRFVSGVEYYNDFYRHFRPNLALTNGKLTDSFNGYAAFLESEVDLKYSKLFIGGRYDQYGGFKEKFSPRISLTKDFGLWSYKLIYGEAFKIPPLQNINLNSTNLVPETVKDYQAEFGLKRNKTELKLNGFYTRIDDIIVFTYDLNTLLESYNNVGFSKVAGTEVLFKTNINKFSFTSTYSFYSLLNSNVSDIIVDTTNFKLGSVGIPKHKYTARLSYIINERNSFGVYYQFQSQKHAQERISQTTEEYGSVEYPATHNINVSCQLKGLLKLFDLNFGINNILNTTNYYVYPLNSGYFPLAGMGREFFIQMKFRLKD
jgi:outer membrane cobalamin receptor